DGQEVASAGQGCTMSHPASGWAEQDPAQWRDGLAAAVRQLLAASGIGAAEGTHLGLASQVDGVVPVDRSTRPRRPGIIRLDRRAPDQADALAAKVGADSIFATTGLVADSSHIAPKIMWLREHEPRTYRAAVSFPPAGGYLLGWLTGTIAQDHANASSTLLYDASSAPWEHAMLDASAIDSTPVPPI